jgi:hypothetical protein
VKRITITITIHGDVARDLREAASATDEIAGVLIVGLSEASDEIRFLGREFIPAPPESYVEQTPRRLNLTPAAYLPALSRAEAMGAAAIFVHSHPESIPAMSPPDDGVDDDLRSVFQIRTRSPFYGALVLHVDGQTLSFSGRVWRDGSFLGSVSLLREIGDRFIFTSSIDAPEPLPPPELFDRQVRAFGQANQSLLASLHVGVVGGGGTGSPSCEMLIRQGVGEITVVDPQTLTITNVTRVYGSGVSDEYRPKVDIVVDNAERIGLGTKINPIQERVSLGVLDRLRSCDIIFACTDDHAGRLDVARLAYWLLIPVFDLGAMIDSNEGAIRGVFSRVDVELPGAPCVMCLGVVDPDRVAQEQLPTHELEARRREGYARELDDPDPAVITYTTLSAALALNELMLRITGAADGSFSRSMLLAHDRRIQLRNPEPVAGHWCADRKNWGAGVTTHFLGRAW